MESLPLIVGATVLALLVLLLLVWLVTRVRRRPRRQGRARLRTVLGARELACYRLLQRALPTHVVMPAVSYARFLSLPDAAEPAAIEGLHEHVADFLVCDHQARPLAVIAVGGQVSARAEVLLRDAAIPLLRYRADPLPTEQDIRDTFHDLESLGGLSRHLGQEAPDGATPDLPGPDGKSRREPRL